MMLGRSGDADGIILQPRQWILDLHRGTLRLGDVGWLVLGAAKCSRERGKGEIPERNGHLNVKSSN